MVGNVWEWTEDCWHGNYSGAPVDGSAWLEVRDLGYGATSGNCNERILRGGAWNSAPNLLDSAVRVTQSVDGRSNDIGFRVARTLTP